MEQFASALTQHSLETDRVIHTVVLFINSGSGGKEGHQLLNSGTQGKQLNEVYSCYLYVFKINDENSRSMGLEFVRSLAGASDTSVNKIVVMAGGGDGTVNWLLTQIIKANIDYTRIVFGALPLGTGNDFAKNLGWTKVSLFKGDSGLKQFFSNIKKSYFQDFDVWEIEVNHSPGGCIVQVCEGDEKKVEAIPMVKQMTNYFSFGMDARVGYHFDKKRSNFQFLNLLLYCLIGCFNRCKKIQTVEKVVDEMKQGEDEEMDIIFSSNADKLNLKKFRHILALNINSYMGGVKGVWQNSKESGIKQNGFHPSSHSDGLLEFVAFKHEWSLGAERVLGGQARKICQGTGQFKFQFNQECSHTYLNFDGEYFKIYKPKSVVIRRSPYFLKKKLRVIRCPQN